MSSLTNSLVQEHLLELFGDLQGAILAHNQRVRETIPAEKLLEYDVSQGWDPLVRFLGVYVFTPSFYKYTS